MGRSFWPAAALLLCTSVPAAAAGLEVTVGNLRNGHGHVRIAVCDKAEFLGDACSYHVIVSAASGAVTARIPDIRPGTYAVSAFQDETDTGRLRRGMFGIPLEGTGFSRNPPRGMGPPSFDRCALRLGEHDGAISIALTYY